jgi:hypothetical protein
MMSNKAERGNIPSYITVGNLNVLKSPIPLDTAFQVLSRGELGGNICPAGK